MNLWMYVVNFNDFLHFKVKNNQIILNAEACPFQFLCGFQTDNLKFKYKSARFSLPTNIEEKIQPQQQILYCSFTKLPLSGWSLAAGSS